MNKLFIRLFVAFAAFSLSLVLTSFIKPVRRSERAITVLVGPHLTTTALDDDEAQIRQIYREYGPAQTRRDRKFFERIETADFTLNVGNKKLSREEDITWMEQGPDGIIYESRVDQLHVFRNLAMAHGYLTIRYGNDLVRERPFVDVWVKRDGTWLIQTTTTSQ
jgi:hypothetical protein